MPRHIRENGDFFKYLRLEQAGERLHNQLNQLERQFASIRDTTLRYFYMMKALVNKQKSSDWMMERKKRNFKIL